MPAPRRRSGGATRSKRKPPPQANAQNPGKQRIVITTLFHTATAKRQSLCHVEVKMTVRWSGEHHYINALWFKVMRTPVSPQLVWTRQCCKFSLCCILWFVTSMNLTRISSFKRSWELLTGSVLVCQDLTLTLEAVNKELRSQTYFTIECSIRILFLKPSLLAKQPSLKLKSRPQKLFDFLPLSKTKLGLSFQL